MSNQEIVTVFFTISAFIALWVVVKSISKLRNYTEDTPDTDRWESYTKIGFSIIILWGLAGRLGGDGEAAEKLDR